MTAPVATPVALPAEKAPAIPCTPGFTAEQCAAANAALARDAAGLAAEAKTYAPAPAGTAAQIEASLPTPAALMQKECDSQRNQLAALKRMSGPSPGEILSAEDAAALPGLLARTERWISKNCL